MGCNACINPAGRLVVCQVYCWSLSAPILIVLANGIFLFLIEAIVRVEVCGHN